MPRRCALSDVLIVVGLLVELIHTVCVQALSSPFDQSTLRVQGVQVQQEARRFRFREAAGVQSIPVGDSGCISRFFLSLSQCAATAR